MHLIRTPLRLTSVYWVTCSGPAFLPFLSADAGTWPKGVSSNAGPVWAFLGGSVGFWPAATPTARARSRTGRVRVMAANPPDRDRWRQDIRRPAAGKATGARPDAIPRREVDRMTGLPRFQ